MKGPQFRLSRNNVPSPKLSSERLGEDGKMEGTTLVVPNAIKKARHTLTESSIILSFPAWSVKVNGSWNYRNNNKYLQQLRSQWTKYLHCHCFIVPHASIDFAKRAAPDKFSSWSCHPYESSRTDGCSQTEDSGEFASEVCMFIIRAWKFLERRWLKWNILLQTASNVFYLQTLSESTGFSVTDR